MDVVSYLSLGALGLGLGTIIGLVIWAHALSNRAESAEDQLLTYVKDETQKTIDAERAKYDLAAMTAARDAQKARADSLEKFVAAQAKETDDAKPLDPADLAGHVLRVSRAAAAGLPPGGASAGPGPIGSVSGNQPA